MLFEHPLWYGGSVTNTTTVRVVTPDTGALGSRTVQEQPKSIRESLLAAAAILWAELWKAFFAARYVWRKARKTSLSYQAESTIPDPSTTLAAKLGIKDPYGDIPDDTDKIELFRTETGFYFTEGMMNDPKYQRELSGVRIRFAHRISDEEATELVEQLEALSMDTDLDDNSTLVLKVLKTKLAERYAK